MIELDGTPNKKSLGANSILGVSLAAAPRRRPSAPALRSIGTWAGGERRATLPVPLMNILNGGGARRFQRRYPGVSWSSPWGAPTFAEALRHGRGGLPRPQGRSQGGAGIPPASGTRGGFRAQPGIEPPGPGADRGKRSGRPATSSAPTSSWALDCAASEFYQGGKYLLEGGGQDAGPCPAGRTLRILGEGLSHRVHRGRICRGRLGGLEAPHRPPRARPCSWWATISSSPTPSGCSVGFAQGIANAVLIKVNQIGSLTETLDCVRLAPLQQLPHDHEPPLGRDRGFLHRRPGSGLRLRNDQDRIGQPQRPHRQVTTSSCASRRSWACPRAYAGKGAFPRVKKMISLKRSP